MDKALPGIIGVIVVGYLIIAAIAAIIIVGLMVASTVAAILTSSFVLSSLYSFNHRKLDWSDYQRIGWYSYAVHGTAMLILSLMFVSFGYNEVWLNFVWSALWPFALIVTFEDGLFGLRENSYVVAGSFFFTCLVVSYTVSYFKYTSETYDDPVVRRRMYRSGLAYFFAATLIPAYFLGQYAIGFVTTRPFTDANIHDAYARSKVTPKEGSVGTYYMQDLGRNIRIASSQEGRFPWTRVIKQKLDFFAPGQDGRWAFYTTESSGGRLSHEFFDFATGHHLSYNSKHLDYPVRLGTLEIYFGPYGKAAILYDTRPDGYLTLFDLETGRGSRYRLDGQYNFDWHSPSWFVDDIEARIPAWPSGRADEKVYLQVFRHNDGPIIALADGERGF